MEKMHQARDAFWNDMDKVQDSVKSLPMEVITQKGTKWGFFSWAAQVWNGVDEREYGNRGYYENLQNFRRGNSSKDSYCGPWIAAALHHYRYGGDEYNFFESCATTTGLFGFAWIGRGFTDSRPMFPNEFTWSLGYKSGIIVNPILKFWASDAYWHIRNNNLPIILLCGSGGLHWTLCYQTKQGGSRWWTQYKFRQIDNGSLINSVERIDEYKEMDWWNAYLTVDSFRSLYISLFYSWIPSRFR